MKKFLLLLCCSVLSAPAYADCYYLMHSNMDAYNNCIANEMRMRRQESMMESSLQLQRQQVEQQQRWMNNQMMQPQNPMIYNPTRPMPPSIYFN